MPQQTFEDFEREEQRRASSLGGTKADRALQRLQRWRRFHTDNPHVYATFSRFTTEAIARGRTSFGARMVWERMRWFSMFETTDPDWKLNNDYAPFYARLFLADHPQHSGLFELRGYDQLDDRAA